MRCRECSAEIKPGLRICPECGATIGHDAVRRGVRCSSCQGRVPKGLRVCPYCGARLRPSWRFRILAVSGLLLAIATTYALKVHVPWTRVRKVVAEMEPPSIAFLVTPTATASRTPTQRMSSTPTATTTRTPMPPTLTQTQTTTQAPAAAAPRPIATQTSGLHMTLHENRSALTVREPRGVSVRVTRSAKIRAAIGT